MALNMSPVSPAQPVLDISGLNITYRTRAGLSPAVMDFNLRVMPGETVGLVGESGCGKSTVAMAIMRYMGRNGVIAGGAIRFNGRDTGTMNEAELRAMRGSGIAMVYQEPFAALNPSIPCGRQLMEVVETLGGEDAANARALALKMLADVNLPDPERVMEAYPHQISGGQQQRVVIAMALLSKPALLLMDEPTTALDVTVEAGIIDLIRDIKGKFGTSIIFISHNLGLVRAVCDRVSVMYAGEVIEEGTVEEVFRDMRHPYTHGLFSAIPQPRANKRTRPLVTIPGQVMLPHERPRGCNFAPRCSFFEKGRCDAPQVVAQRPVQGSSNHSLRCERFEEITLGGGQQTLPPPQGARSEEFVLRVEEMRKYYPLRADGFFDRFRGITKRLVKGNDGVDLVARRGETVAIVGESGSGKSTFAKVLMGLETATGGKVMLGDQDITRTPVQERSRTQRSNLQMVFQNPSETLNPSMTVGSQIARVVRKLGGLSDQGSIDKRVLELLDLVKLPREFARRRPRQLSGGQKQRVAIARAFAGTPDMVVADEPVSALDVSVQAAVIELLISIQRQNNTTIVFISHDLSLVQYVADRVVVMYLGQIMEQGTVSEVFSSPYHPYTEALISAIPVADPTIEKRKIVLDGTLPSPLDPPKGCAFCTRCPRRIGSICDEQAPAVQVTDKGHTIKCHIPIAELATVPPVFRQKEDELYVATIQ